MSASVSDAVRPAAPAPTTRTLGVVSIRMVVNGSLRRALAIPARTSRMALSVARGRLSRCAQEHCSRIFDCVYWYGLSPARTDMARKV